jgi:hypothetical protein
MANVLKANNELFAFDWPCPILKTHAVRWTSLLPPNTLDCISGFRLKEYFKNEEDFSLTYKRLPFKKIDNLCLLWGNWLVRVFYEEGNIVKEESSEI